jgi:hypothetical protein
MRSTKSPLEKSMLARTTVFAVAMFSLLGCAAPARTGNLRDLSQRKVAGAVEEILRRVFEGNGYDMRFYISIAPTAAKVKIETFADSVTEGRLYEYEVTYSDDTIDTADVATVAIALVNKDGVLADLHTEIWVWTDGKWQTDTDDINRRGRRDQHTTLPN